MKDRSNIRRSPIQPAFFLDRDGVIIANRDDYVRSIDEVEFLPGALDAMARLSSSKFFTLVVTNQSAVGRGLLLREEADAINDHIVRSIEKAGGVVHGVYMCPHHPEEMCPCRKPSPGLILEAADRFHIDLTRSILVGDAVSDLQAGYSAGVGTLALVRTGRGQREALALKKAGGPPAQVFNDLLEAVFTLNPEVAAEPD